MKKYINATIIILIILFSIPAFSGYADNHVRLDRDGDIYYTYYNDKEWIHITRYNSVNMKSFWAFTVADPNNCHINSVSLDPTNTKLVYWGACRYKNSSTSEDAPQGYYFLNIIDRKTQKAIVSFNHGQNLFSFSPSGDAIVYAEAIPGERGSPPPPGYKGGVWIYNFKSKTKILIYPAPVGITDLNWSSHDGNIYILNYPEVYCYKVERGKGEVTSYNGIYFSHDGKYNIYIYDRFRIFRTSDNKEMIEMEKQINNYQFIGWSNRMKSAIFRNGESVSENIIFDLDEGKIIGKFTGGLIGTNAEGTKFAVHPIGPDKKTQVNKVEILNLLDLIKK